MRVYWVIYRPAPDDVWAEEPAAPPRTFRMVRQFLKMRAEDTVPTELAPKGVVKTLDPRIDMDRTHWESHSLVALRIRIPAGAVSVEDDDPSILEVWRE